MVMIIVFFVGTFGLNFQMTSALMATEVFDKGAGAYGLLGSVVAIGSLSGALLAARRGRPRLRLIVLSAIAFGVVEIVAGLMPTYFSFMALLIPLGLCQMTLAQRRQRHHAARGRPDHARPGDGPLHGRADGRHPLGAPLVGALAEAFGARWSLIGGGLISATAAIVAGALLARREGMVLRDELHLSAASRQDEAAPRGRPRDRAAGLTVTVWRPSARRATG